MLDLLLCLICGAYNDLILDECEVCVSTLRGTKEPSPMAPEASPATPQTTTPRPVRRVLDKVDEFLRDLRPLVSEVRRPDTPRPAPAPKPSEATVKAPVAMPRPDPASTARKPESTSTPSPAVPVPARPASPMPEKPVTQTRPAPAIELEARLAPRNKPATPPAAKIRGRAEAPSRIPRKNARPPARGARSRISAETAGGLVLAASRGLIFAEDLDPALVGAGIAAFLIGFGAFLTVDSVRGARVRPPRFDALLLVAGTILTVSAPLLRGLPRSEEHTSEL